MEIQQLRTVVLLGVAIRRFGMEPALGIMAARRHDRHSAVTVWKVLAVVVHVKATERLQGEVVRWT